MNRLQYWITAKTAYNIQSPFLYRLYFDVLEARVDPKTVSQHGANMDSKYNILVYKLCTYYNATPIKDSALILSIADTLLAMPDGSMIGVVNSPHQDKLHEKEWGRLYADPIVSLSVDIFYAGVVFTSKKLSKQHYLLR